MRVCRKLDIRSKIWPQCDKHLSSGEVSFDCRQTSLQAFELACRIPRLHSRLCRERLLPLVQRSVRISVRQSDTYGGILLGRRFQAEDRELSSRLRIQAVRTLHYRVWSQLRGDPHHLSISRTMDRLWSAVYYPIRYSDKDPFLRHAPYNLPRLVRSSGRWRPARPIFRPRRGRDGWAGGVGELRLNLPFSPQPGSAELAYRVVVLRTTIWRMFKPS